MIQAAYGYRLEGAPAGPWLDLTGAEHWPVLRIEHDPTPGAPHVAVEPESLRVRRGPEVTDDHIPHPFLVWAILELAERRGVEVIHGGVVLGADGAWGVVGTKEMGKSTLLAECAARGLEVLSDDIVVVAGTRCFAGPRCLDLRRDAVEDGAIAWQPVRMDSRARVTLPPAPAEAELRGFIHLSWGDELGIRSLPPAERLAGLAARRKQDGWPRDGTRVLDLALLPAFELRRPRDRELLGAGAAALAEAIGAS